MKRVRRRINYMIIIILAVLFFAINFSLFLQTNFTATPIGNFLSLGFH